jgi:hypothetical protein
MLEIQHSYLTLKYKKFDYKNTYYNQIIMASLNTERYGQFAQIKINHTFVCELYWDTQNHEFVYELQSNFGQIQRFNSGNSIIDSLSTLLSPNEELYIQAFQIFPPDGEFFNDPSPNNKLHDTWDSLRDIYPNSAFQLSFTTTFVPHSSS